MLWAPIIVLLSICTFSPDAHASRQLQHLRLLNEEALHELHCRVVSPFHATSTPEWRAESLASLSRWRSSLMERDHKRWNANHGSEADKAAASDVLQGLPMYNLYYGYMTCPPPMTLTYYGPGNFKDPAVFSEGGKWACGPLPQEDCVIYSLGSSNDYRFEEAILQQTNCKIWTFDCTVQGHSINAERHVYEHVCVGDPPLNNQHPEWKYERLAEITKRLGHRQITYLKIDCEGCEFDIMEHWTETDTHLPLQIAVEIHEWGHLYSDVAMYMRHMAGLGYAVLTKSDNPWRGQPSDPGCCAELLLLKVEQRFCSRHTSPT